MDPESKMIPPESRLKAMRWLLQTLEERNGSGFEWFVKMAVPPKSQWLWGQPKKSQTFIFLDLFGILFSTNMMQNSIESVGWGERKRLADRMNSFLVLLFRRCTASVARANYSIETELLKHRFLPRKEPAIPLSPFLFH